MFALNGSVPKDGRRHASGCALVTGAARGIGASIACSLAEEGWAVAVNYSRDRQGADTVAAAITSAGGRAIAIQADVAEPVAVDSLFEVAESQLGPVLVLVNNAGIRDDMPAGFLMPDRWSRVLDVNLSGTFHTIRRALGNMVQQRFGRIVNLSSISAQTPLPGQACYAASKAGIEGLTRAVAIDVARRGVTVNAIAPGLIETSLAAELTEAAAQAAREAMPARRVGQPDEVAKLVRYLISEDAAYVNGAVITIDGALTAGLAVLRNPGRSAQSARTVNH